uniref:S24 family peptidase n=1 Tax=Roseihalotalea indica TaxID=2867963 RepID=A0AA49GKB9_9BACT|nr:S24 family peptidase [Tunicatimonas sp. TK19036]
MADNQYKNSVNERFFECIHMLKSRKVIHSDREFALAIEISPSNLGDIKANRRSVTIEILNRALDKFGINSAFIISGMGQPFVNQSQPEGPSKVKEVIMVATQDTSGNVTVPLINHKAAANFMTGYQTQEFFEEQESILLPDYMIKDGQCYAVQVSGDSMEPTLLEDDWVICRLLDNNEYRTITDGGVYVVVSHDRGIQIKRLRNRLHQYGYIRCLSDNPKHEPFDIPENELLQIWKVEWHLRSYLPEPSPEIDDIQGKLDQMQAEMLRLSSQINNNMSQN